MAALCFAAFETRDLATRPATRCKVRDYIHNTEKMPLIRASRDEDVAAITAIYTWNKPKGG